MMRLLSIRIFLLLSLLASYILLFSPQGVWDQAAPWFGEVESVKSCCDMGGALNFPLKLKEHQLEQWDAMFQQAGVDVSITEGKFVTQSPFSLISTSVHEKHIQSMEAYPREGDYHELWMFFTLNPDKKHVLEVQHPELLDTPIYDKMIEVFHLLGLLAGSALFLFSFYIPRASFGFWSGLGLTLALLITLSATSSLGLEWWSSSNFANWDIMISLILLGGLSNAITWSLLYFIYKRYKIGPVT